MIKINNAPLCLYFTSKDIIINKVSLWKRRMSSNVPAKCRSRHWRRKVKHRYVSPGIGWRNYSRGCIILCKLTDCCRTSVAAVTRDAELLLSYNGGSHLRRWLYCFWYVQGVSEKSNNPPKKKTFWNIFTSVKSFCAKFCKFVGTSYPHTFTNFCTFILVFHQMALIFPRVPIVFILFSFD